MSYTANYVKPDVVTFGPSPEFNAPDNFRHGVPVTDDSMRRQILWLESVMKAIPGAQLDCPVTHHFAPGVYARQMDIAAGTCVVGKIHKHAHLNIISKGRVRVLTEFGVDVLTAPHTFVSLPGTKRVVIADENTVWTTIHLNPGDTQDLEQIEDYVIAKDYEQFDAMLAIENKEQQS